MKLPPSLLCVTLALLALTACGSSTTKTVVVTRTTGAPTGSGGRVTTPGSGATGATGSTTTGTTTGSTMTVTASISPPTPTATLRLTTFRTPSKNIGCVMLGGTARCDISQRSWVPPARPAKCPNVVNFGQGLEVDSSGAGRFVCAGDTALDPTGTPLPYGEASVEGNLTCLSETNGVTCTNRSDGHGFGISRQSYRIF